MATLDLRTRPGGVCFGCGQVADGTALEVWASASGPVLAVLCTACQADVAVCEALVGHLIAHAPPGSRRIEWESGEPVALVSDPATKATLLARLGTGRNFAFCR